MRRVKVSESIVDQTVPTLATNQDLTVKTETKLQREGKGLNLFPFGKYHLCMATQKKHKIAVMRPFVEALGEIQVTKRSTPEDKRQTKFEKRMYIITSPKH